MPGAIEASQRRPHSTAGYLGAGSPTSSGRRRPGAPAGACRISSRTWPTCSGWSWTRPRSPIRAACRPRPRRKHAVQAQPRLVRRRRAGGLRGRQQGRAGSAGRARGLDSSCRSATSAPIQLRCCRAPTASTTTPTSGPTCSRRAGRSPATPPPSDELRLGRRWTGSRRPCRSRIAAAADACTLEIQVTGTGSPARSLRVMARRRRRSARTGRP